MTADAKVGLLLGLVFIAIIAFVINGLPDFVQSGREKPAVEMAVPTQTSSSLVIEPAVVDVARSLQEKRTTVRYVDPPVDTTVLEEYAGPVSSTLTTPAVSPAADTAKAQESQTPAARLDEQTAEPIQTPTQPQTVIASKSQPAVVPGVSHVVEDGESLGEIARKYYGDQEGNKLATIQMLYEANKTILESPDAIRVGDQLVIPKTKSAAVPEQAAPVKKEAAADSLMDKFKNVFTSVEKKPETVTKSSQPQPVDKKPAPRPQASAVDKTALLKPATVTKSTQPVDKRTTSSTQAPVVDKTALLKTDKLALPKTDKSQPVKVEKPLPAKGVMEYTVKSGDYPFKIAQQQLGDGNRYTEILKLNGLSEKDRLKVGTKLKIPKK